MDEAIMGQAEPLFSGAVSALDTPTLVQNLLERFHHVHRAELPGLIALASRVEKVHAAHPECPVGLTRFLERAEEALEEHMRKEEEILFPLMLSDPNHPMIAMPVQVMRDEHDDHLKTIRDLYRITGALVLPEDACGSWRALYQGLKKFAEDLAIHIETENDVLFPRFRKK
jgi:regulator of cell morphogenesis and NO signaling